MILGSTASSLKFGWDIYLVKTDSLGNLEETSGGALSSSSLLPNRLQLTPFYPDPFQSQTTIKFFLPTRSKVILKIYNLTGQLVKTLINETKEPGYYRLSWDGWGEKGEVLANGIYFYQLELADYKLTKKLIKLR